jgi:hypothetical protein
MLKTRRLIAVVAAVAATFAIGSGVQASAATGPAPHTNAVTSHNHLVIASPDATSTYIYGGFNLLDNSWVASPDGKTKLYMQVGDLVVFVDEIARFETEKETRELGAYASFQKDGNLVVYTSSHQALWASQTSGFPDCAVGGCYLAVQNDGNVVIYDSFDGAALWATNTERR